MRMVRRSLGLGLLLALAMLWSTAQPSGAAPVGPANPSTAQVATTSGHDVGTYSGNSYYCDYGTAHLVCLFYDQDQQGAYFGFANSATGYLCHITNFAGYTFNAFVPPGYADGQGAPVLNDAASIADTSDNPGDIFYGQNYTGNYDYIYAHRYGNLSSYTLNNNGSANFFC